MAPFEAGDTRRACGMTVSREDLGQTALHEHSLPQLSDGEVLLSVSRVGVTANNVTYAVLGESFRYWDFFPTEPGLGIVPLWGFADVTDSRVEGITAGSRYYGYLPCASHLVVRPGRVDSRGFRDESAHRGGLPSPYNAYSSTTGDVVYRPDREDLLVLFRPLFYTSFMLADQLEDNGYFGAEVLALSSASSKTAYSTAFLLKASGRRVVGLTSPANVGFTESLGCYDVVLGYDAISELDPATATAYLDLSGRAELRTSLHEHLGGALVHDAIVGVTSQEPAGGQAATGPRSALFFAPDQMRKRTADWGRAGLDARFAEAWERFAPAAREWVDVVTGHGFEALRAVWLEVLAGRTSPRTGHIVTF